MSSALSTIELIAGREIRLRLRSRAWVIITIVTAIVLAAFAIVIGVIASRDSQVEIAVPTAQRAELGDVLDSAATLLSTPVTVRGVAGNEQGRESVSADDVDAYVTVASPQALRVVVKRDIDDELRKVLNVASSQRLLADRLGSSPGEVATTASDAQVEVAPLSPPRSYDPERLVLGIVAGVLIYMALLLAGQTVAQGVVEEKSSRVVELLLAAVRPWQLMAGKVLGLGLVGLLQVFVIGAAGMVAGVASGSLDISGSSATGIIGWLLLWFLLGYLAYAFVFAALGALVSRQEDVAGVVTPVTLVLVVGYVIGVSVLPSDPDNSFVAILSMIPCFSPTLMPIRLAMGGVPAWQTALALALILVTIPLLVALSGRIYRNAVVRSGARVKLREAMRSA